MTRDQFPTFSNVSVVTSNQLVTALVKYADELTRACDAAVLTASKDALVTLFATEFDAAQAKIQVALAARPGTTAA